MYSLTGLVFYHYLEAILEVSITAEKVIHLDSNQQVGRGFQSDVCTAQRKCEIFHLLSGFLFLPAE